MPEPLLWVLKNDFSQRRTKKFGLLGQLVGAGMERAGVAII